MARDLTFPQPIGRYTRGAIAFHWLLAVLLFGQIGFGWFLETIPRGTPARGLYINLHKSMGLVLAVLIVLRICWRLTHRTPSLPSFVSEWERALSQGTQYGLYLCMLIMPLSGYIASNFSKHGVKFFNAVTLPPWGTDDRPVYDFFNTAHVLTSYLFVALIVLHLLGAGRHLLHRDGVVSRMWPHSKHSNPES